MESVSEIKCSNVRLSMCNISRHDTDVQILGTRGWSRRAENRDELRQLSREAKARKGL
jgi:hypothetical protein